MTIRMQYACFACRKAFKKAKPAESVVAYLCPECAQPLVMMGTAFRAPRKADEPQWCKVELLVRAGILFYRNSGPRPKRLNELPAFLQAHARAKQSPGERLLQRVGQSAPRTPSLSQGRLKRLNAEGKPKFEFAGRELSSWMTVLVHERNEWHKGTFRITGDGGKVVEPHVAVGSKKIFIGLQTVLRWPE